MITEDLNVYFGLGNVFDRTLIEDMKRDVEEIKELQREIQRSTKARKINELLKQKTEDLQTRILQNRVRGRTVNAIFSDTIRHLLGTKGPLSTAELHPFIQNIHPDICDDSIDRVINGQHFGKRWKHLVRDAQQSLKKKGIIELRGQKWYLMSRATPTSG